MSENKTIRDIQVYTKKLDVLYVEDEENIRLQMLDILKLFFNNVYTAVDGSHGLKLSRKHKFDLIITDIQMPNLNGLDMIETIHIDKADIPVIITTAFSDQEYFLKSIDLRIDKYLIKPIDIDKAKETFYSVAKIIDDRAKAKEYEVNKIQERINLISSKIVSEIANSYQAPCVVYTNYEIRYVNDSFCSLFQKNNLEEFFNSEITFDQRDDFMYVLKDYNEEDKSRNRVSISNDDGRKIYRVTRNNIDMDVDGTISTIYLFNDITLEEYQKIKIKSYTELLEDFIFKTHYKEKKETTKLVKTTEPDLKTESEVKKEFEATKPEVDLVEKVEDNTEKLSINDEENSLLRRSHTFKTTAKEYVDELDDEILLELQELDELDRDFRDSILILQEDANVDGIKNMSNQLERYAHEISMLFEFKDLAYAIRSLSEMLSSVNEDKLDEKNIKKIVLFLAGIQSDLSDWRNLIFIEQSSLDIHYLDSSLYSACLQIELALSEDVKEIESEEDDLILF